MIKKLILNLYKYNVKYIKRKLKHQYYDSSKYCLPTKDVYYSKNKNYYYFKVATATGFICIDISIDELFKNSEVLDGLDRKSFAYVHYVAGKLENLANKDQNALYTFYAISPFNNNTFIVKCLFDMSIEEWDILEAYKTEKYYNLDKPSISQFFKQYFYVQSISEDNSSTKLHLVK